MGFKSPTSSEGNRDERRGCSARPSAEKITESVSLAGGSDAKLQDMKCIKP